MMFCALQCPWILQLLIATQMSKILSMPSEISSVLSHMHSAFKKNMRNYYSIEDVVLLFSMDEFKEIYKFHATNAYML